MNREELDMMMKYEDLLNKGYISVIGFWEKIREFKTISQSDLQRVQTELFKLEAKNFDPLGDPLNVPRLTNQVHLTENMKPYEPNRPRDEIPTIGNNAFSSWGSTPAEPIKYREPKSYGEKMFAKISFRETDNLDMMMNAVRRFMKDKPICVESITLEKREDGIHFLKSVVGKSHEVYSQPSRPELVTPKELEAILQIISEWGD